MPHPSFPPNIVGTRSLNLLTTINVWCHKDGEQVKIQNLSEYEIELLLEHTCSD